MLGGNCFESLESRLAMDGAMSAWSVEQLPTYGTYDAFRAAVIARAEHDFATMFGQPIEAAQPIDYGLPARLELYASDASDLLSGANYSDAQLASGTIGNNQVAGVDESGRSESDGSFVYLLRDGKLEIVDVRDPAQPKFVSTTTLDGWDEGEYLFGSRLTVISSEVSRNLMTTSDPSLSSSGYADSLPGATLVTVYDVSDPSSPQIIEKTRLDGNYVDSRAVDDKVYVILASGWPTLPAPEAICDS
ncbi:MAG TPA: beta-propeller domain-containing protein, partial [Pirellulaceae bacterium]|nr:beta-propeller domain-containing protein [Pirellulaceae bacterium]